MTRAYPIPTDALDDRLAWTGMSGSGKTYNAGTAIERLLAYKARACIVDPLGVWWGLRLRPDGGPSRFRIVVFGGPRGDIAITETSGRIIGETVAGMAESCIVDLSEFDTEASQRRFMLAFVMGLYARLDGELLHLVLDEADMWAPQNIRDKEGDATKLHHHVQKIVRRGRVKGFIPWLITQRPAEISKSVLSMCPGLISGNLISAQDIDAAMDWVGKRADKETAELIRTRLPTFAKGEAVVYIPARGVLEIARFPEKATYDSSRSPERGEKRSAVALKPIDLGALKDRLASVEAAALEDDPAPLRARIAELERAARDRPTADPAAIAEAEQRGHARGFREGQVAAEARLLSAVDGLRRLANGIESAIGIGGGRSGKPESQNSGKPGRQSVGRDTEAGAPTPAKQPAGASLPPARQKILDAIAWANATGQAEPTRQVVAFLARVSWKAGGFRNNLGALSSSGLIRYPGAGTLALTKAGREKARAPAQALDHAAMMERIGAILAPARLRVLEAVIAAYPGAASREAVAEIAGVSASSGGFRNNLGGLSSLGLVTYPASGEVRAADILFPEPKPGRRQ